MSQRQEVRDQSEEKIFAAAMHVFSRYGYDGTSVRMIATEAGVSPGLLYNYFSSKEELLVKIYEAGLRDVQASFFDLPNDGGVIPYLQNNFRIVRQKHQLWRLIYLIRTQESAMAVLGNRVKKVQQEVIKLLEKRLKATHGKKARAEAVFLNASLEGIIFHYLFEEDFELELAEQTILEKYTS